MRIRYKRSGKVSIASGYCEWADEKDYVHIYNLFVFPEYRRQGKARQILQLAIDEIRSIGYKGAISIVAQPKDPFIDLARLVSFYEGMGLEVYEYYG